MYTGYTKYTKMVTIAFANEKGGVGKSMSTLCVGYALLERGFTVLWVDADQQGSLTQSFRYAPPARLTLGPLLLGQAKPDEVLAEVAEGGGYLLPSGPNLNECAQKRANLPGAELVLRKVLSAASGFDYCLIDTPGSLGMLTTAALTAADYVFIPAQPQAFGIQGLMALVANCQLVQDGLNPKLKLGGLFFAMYNRNSRELVMKDLAALIEGHQDLGPLVMKQTIRKNTRLEQAVTEKLNLYALDPESPGAIDYSLLTGEILARLD